METRMSTIGRRTFLAGVGLVGASTVLADGLRSVAHADKSITFSGWVFKPER